MKKHPSLEYLAGVFDGEGSISLSKFKRQDTYQYQIRIALGMVDARVPRLFEIAFGGALKWHHRNNPKWRPCLYWAVQSATAVEAVLIALTPHLITKKKQAELALRFVKRMQKRQDSLRGGYKQRLSAAEQRIRTRYVEQMRYLNTGVKLDDSVGDMEESA